MSNILSQIDNPYSTIVTVYRPQLTFFSLILIDLYYTETKTFKVFQKCAATYQTKGARVCTHINP